MVRGPIGQVAHLVATLCLILEDCFRSEADESVQVPV